MLLATSRQGNTNVRGAFSPQYGWGIVDAQAAVAAPGAVGTQEPAPVKGSKGTKGGGRGDRP